jgi:hypothetical protein
MTRLSEMTTEQQVASLPFMSIGEFDDAYRLYFPDASTALPRTYRQRKLAYRIQELAYGGLDKVSSEKIEEAIRNLKNERTGSSRPDRMPMVGTRLSRVYKGKRHDATVGDGFFTYAGKRYPTVSAVAHKITGRKVDGFAFFGLGSKSKAGQE